MTFREKLAEELKDPEFKKLWDESEEEFQKECARIEAEIEAENLKNNISKNSEQVA